MSKLRKILLESAANDVLGEEALTAEAGREFIQAAAERGDLTKRFESIAREKDPETMKRMTAELKEDPMGIYLRMELEHLMQIAVEPTEETMSRTLPSYVLWRLFKENRLAELGVSDEAFLAGLKYKPPTAATETTTAIPGHLNFAAYLGDKVEVPEAYKLDMTMKLKLLEVVEAEVAKLYRRLLRPINYEVGRDAQFNEMPFRRRALTDRQVTKLRNGPDGEVASELPGSDKENELAHEYFKKGADI